MQYPKREQFFAHKYVRILTRVAAVQDIGPYGVLLCTIIVHQEDAVRYSKPVTFWNDQLMATAGFKKWDSLDRVRKACIKAGWLAYQSQGKRKAGLYFVTIPEQFNDGLDTAVTDHTPSAEYNRGYKEGYNRGYKEGYREGDKRGDTEGDRGGYPSTLPLNPIPDPTPPGEHLFEGERKSKSGTGKPNKSLDDLRLSGFKLFMKDDRDLWLALFKEFGWTPMEDMCNTLASQKGTVPIFFDEAAYWLNTNYKDPDDEPRQPERQTETTEPF